MHSVDHHVERIDRDGFIVIERAISEDEIREIKDALSPWLQGKHVGRNDFEGMRTERVYALLAKAPEIAKIIEHPETLAIADRLLPENYWLSAAAAINVHPGETPQALHRDASGCGVSTMWAFDDFTEHNGATELIPGSHRWSDGREPSETETVKVTMPAGSVLIFHGRVYHRGGANNSQSARLGISPQYIDPMVRQIENMVLAVPPDLARHYSDRIQGLLGYSVVEPFFGFVDGRHPKKLIDAGYQGRKYRTDFPAS